MKDEYKPKQGTAKERVYLSNALMLCEWLSGPKKQKSKTDVSPNQLTLWDSRENRVIAARVNLAAKVQQVKGVPSEKSEEGK